MKKLCFGCMRQKGNSPVCEFCGYDENSQNLSHQLPIGTILQNQYLVGRVLGQGGFGITYIGWDQHLSIPVAIKEYYPGGVVQRHAQLGLSVVCTNGEAPEVFAKHRERFLKEARALAQFSEVPQIVQIKSYFSENNTAYIVMEYIDGITLKSHLKQLGRPMTEQEALGIMEPVLRALQKVHQQHLIHRDISPDNIMLPKNGGVKLIDFGTVRYVDTSGVSKSTEAVLKPGFAPIEQYNTRGELGTWTDVYALCATFHYLLTGKVPTDVHERLVSGDSLTVLRSKADISQDLILTLEKGMKIIPAERIQTVEQLYKMLYPREAKNTQPQQQKQEQKRKTEKKSSKLLPLIGAAAAVIAIGAGILLLKPISSKTSMQATMTASEAESMAEETTAPATVSWQELQYQEARVQMEAGNYSAAMDLFLELGDYQDSARLAEQCRLAIGYAEAEALAAAGEHAKAGIAFAKLGEYRDAHERSCQEWNRTRYRDSIAGGFSYPYERVILGLKKDGTVVASGTNSHGQKEVSSWTDIIEVYTDGALSYGLRSDGTVAVTKYKRMNNVVHGFNEISENRANEVSKWTNVADIAFVGGEVIGIRYDGSIITTGDNELNLSQFDNVADLVYIMLYDTDNQRYHYETVALKMDGTIAHFGDIFFFDPELWTDIERIKMCGYGIVGFRTDGSVVAEHPGQAFSWPDSWQPNNWQKEKYVCSDWTGVVDVCGVFRLKADGTVDAPEEYADLVSGWSNVKSLFGNNSSLYAIKHDGTVLFAGKGANGSQNVGHWTDIAYLYVSFYKVGLKADGTLLIADYIDMDCEKWTGLRVPEQ